jgi:NADH-quinone oxidoreductase subunit L
MGGLWKYMKITWITFLIGTLALVGTPFFSGFYSKEHIIEAAGAAHVWGAGFAHFATLIGVLVTSLYSFRVYFLVFHGKPRANDHVMGHVHESPMVMVGPLLVLGLGAVFAGYFGAPYFVGEENHEFWRHAISILPAHPALAHMEHIPEWVEMAPLAMGISGIALAYLFYMIFPSVPGALASGLKGVHLFLLNKWYFDELYDLILVRPAKWIGYTLWKKGDGWLIDGFGPDGVSTRVVAVTNQVVRLQTGYLYHYAFAMILGLILLLGGFWLVGQ